MKRFIRAVISLPVLAAPVFIMAGSMPAHAQGDIAPVDVLRILAHSQAANAKCGYQPGASSELNDYVAKAEVSAASTGGTKQAQHAIAAGISDGKSMACGQAGRELVAAALDASRRAMAQVRGYQPAPRRVVAQRKPNLRTSQDATDIRPRKARQPETRVASQSSTAIVEAAPKGDLSNYSRMTAAYYIEYRCRHLSQNQAYHFWQMIVRRHNSLLSAYGPQRVAQAKSDAQAMAKSGYRGGCGANTRRIVRERYSHLISG